MKQQHHEQATNRDIHTHSKKTEQQQYFNSLDITFSSWLIAVCSFISGAGKLYRHASTNFFPGTKLLIMKQQNQSMKEQQNINKQLSLRGIFAS